MTDPYQLIYWPVLQGRGEFVRLALEDAGVAYEDVARGPETPEARLKVVFDALDAPGPVRHYAMPMLRHGQTTLTQTANILMYLGPRLGLVPDDELGRLAVNQYQLTLMDVAAEAHDTHHPVCKSLYYEDQRVEAKRAAEEFVTARLPRLLGYFEKALENSGTGYLHGTERSYADLSLFQVMSGLSFAFPKAMARLGDDIGRCRALWSRIQERPNITAYLASDRRLAFNEHGVFRHYPELDV